jgi:hypothetical protein
MNRAHAGDHFERSARLARRCPPRTKDHARRQARIRRRPFGSGIGSPNSFAVSIHRRIASSALLSASSWVGPWAAEPVLCKIHLLLHAILSEQVMTAAHLLLEAQTLKQVTQVVKTDGGIGGPAEHPPKSFVRSHTGILPSAAKGCPLLHYPARVWCPRRFRSGKVATKAGLKVDCHRRRQPG